MRQMKTGFEASTTVSRLALILLLTAGSIAVGKAQNPNSKPDSTQLLISGDLSRLREGKNLVNPQGGLGAKSEAKGGVLGKLEDLDPKHTAMRLLVGNNLGRAIKAGAFAWIRRPLRTSKQSSRKFTDASPISPNGSQGFSPPTTLRALKGIGVFDDIVQIHSENGGPFSLPGDSGSIIVEEETGHPVALLFAGDGVTTDACPVWRVAQMLNVLPA